MNAPRTVGDLRFVLVWSHERRAWWRADGCGYTTKIAEAGLYDPATVEQRYTQGSKFHVVVPLGGRPPRVKP